VLLLVGAALLAARVWVPLAAVVSRHLPAHATAARLAAAGGVRRPLRTVVTVGFVTAAVGAVVFAGSYRATLLAGAADTAAFDVPTDVRITDDGRGTDPLALEAVQPLAGQAFPVIRTVAGVRTSAASSDAVALLGISPDVLPRLARWDRTVGASDPSSVSALLAAPPPASGTPIPDDATSLTLAVESWSRSAPGAVDVTAWITTPDGREASTALLLRGSDLSGPLQPGRGRRLTALVLQENAVDASRRQHHTEGGTVEAVLAGRVTLTAPGGVWNDWSSRTATAQSSGAALSIDYQLTGAAVVVRPGLADRAPLRVLVDPVTAARGPALRLDLGGGEAVAATVIGVLPRWPTAGPRFVVADRSSLAATLDDHEPGTAGPREIWADGGGDPTTTATLETQTAGAPWDTAVVATRSAREATLAADPVAQGAGWLLLVAAAAAAVVAIASLVLLVTGERRDDAAQLLAQEADGVATTALRRSLWWRAVAAAAPALVVGVAAGLLLTRAVSTLIALSASGAAPVPPLAPAVGRWSTAAVLLGGLAVALAWCAVVAGRTLRSAWPSRVEQDLR
jgi:hypothetical protein